MKNLIYIFVILLIFNNLYSQEIKKFPYPILPGQKIEFQAQDTLWIITHKQIKKTIATAKKNEILQQINTEQKKQIDTLKEIITQQESLIDTLKADRDFYIKTYEETEQQVSDCQKIIRRKTNLLKFTVVGGITLAVATFFLGAYLFH